MIYVHAPYLHGVLLRLAGLAQTDETREGESVIDIGVLDSGNPCARSSDSG